MTFSGRMSDIAHLTLKTFLSDPILNVIFTDNNELKVLAQKPMAVIPDRKSYLTCFFHSFFMYLATRGGVSNNPTNPDDPHFLFPGMQTSPSKVVNDILKKLAETKKFDFIHSKSSSKIFRYGATTTMYTALHGGSEVTAAHGGWDGDKNAEGNAMIEYLICLHIMVARGARILAGYENCRLLYKLPQLVFLDEADTEFKNRIDRFLNLILHLDSRHVSTRPGEKSYSVIKTTFAVFLMHLEKVSYNLYNCYIKKVYNYCNI